MTPVQPTVLDITGEVCPMTFVRTRLALDRLPPGELLLVRLRGDEPRRSVPENATALGHTVLERRGCEGDGSAGAVAAEGPSGAPDADADLAAGQSCLSSRPI